ncbi:hypothetical protein FJU30_22450 [Affinibrenneria salicis]|uniref:DUF3137 domain-containing protein n=1 Tax=Affinibrenneria salicis TaxID=2590031 RepID=A0A5J5FS55_9GAMM|nr:hypothetical protein [Affinibrenneria salicis]KAA8996127.1 hypothetical protein FJU30_22450 [Affinibrenneria salicis]
MTHNQRLKALLTQLDVGAEAAASNAELLAVLDRAKSFGGQLKYDNKALFWWLALGLCICAGALIYYLALVNHVGSVSGDAERRLWYAGALGVALSAVPIFLLLARKKNVDDLSAKIVRKKILFDNDLVDRTPPADLIKCLCQEFYEFNRGNYSREIRGWTTGVASPARGFEIDYYHLHYVNQRTETRLVSDGRGGTKQETKTVYDHFNRYMLVAPLPQLKGLCVLTEPNGHKGITWKPSSGQFNRIFSVRAPSEHLAAKFLQPAVILAFLQLNGEFKRVNVEVSPLGEGRCCISFRDADLLRIDLGTNIETPDAFVRALFSAPCPLPKYQRAVSFIKEIARFNDNNFQ